jgi:hypothetical protein
MPVISYQTKNTQVKQKRFLTFEIIDDFTGDKHQIINDYLYYTWQPACKIDNDASPKQYSVPHRNLVPTGFDLLFAVRSFSTPTCSALKII